MLNCGREIALLYTNNQGLSFACKIDFILSQDAIRF